MLDALIELIPVLRNSLLNDREKRLIMLVVLVSLPMTIFLISFAITFTVINNSTPKQQEEIEQRGPRIQIPQRRIIYDQIEKDAMYLLLSTAFEKYNFEYAEQIAEKLMLNDSTDNFAQYITAKMKIENQKFAEANEILLRLKERNYKPDSLKTLFISVVSFDELTQLIADTVSLSATQLAKVGERYLAAGNSSAYIFFKKALEKDSSNTEALLQSARWYMNNREFRTAEKLLLQLLQIDSTSARVLGRYAILLHETGRIKSALAFYKNAIDRNPYDFNLAFNLGELYLSSLNDNQNAKIYFQKAVELSPSIWQSHFKLGLIALGENNLDTAINYLRTADGYSSDNLRILHLLAAAYERNGDNVNAVRTYDRILSVNPLDDIALYKNRLLRQR